jgi:hypothetical protein
MPQVAGVVYTKPWVVSLVLDIAGYTDSRDLTSLTIVEPSCGGGAFLEEIIRRLCVSAAARKSFVPERMDGCVRAFDSDSDSVACSRDKVVAVLCSHGMRRNEAVGLAKEWVIVGDYLETEGLNADFVVGNPPYVRATEIAPNKRKTYCSHLDTMTMGCDIFIGFIEHGLAMLSEGGSLCYICADRWMQNAYGKALRGLVATDYHLDTIVRMHGVDAFEDDVDAYPAITKITHAGSGMLFANCAPTFSPEDVPQLSKWLFSENHPFTSADAFAAAELDSITDDRVIPLADPRRVQLVTELSERFPTLEESGVTVGIGIATGCDKVFVVDEPDVVEPDRMLPLFYMRDYRRGYQKKRWLINPWNSDGSLVDLEAFPRLRRYLFGNEAILRKRHVARKHEDNWYRTIDKVNWNLVDRPMLLFPDLAAKPDPVYDDGSLYPHHNCYWLVSDRWNLNALGGLLMSDVAEFFIDALGVKMRGGTMRFQAQYLRLIHVPRPEEISPEVTRALSEAFVASDRARASKAASAAYGIE